MTDYLKQISNAATFDEVHSVHRRIHECMHGQISNVTYRLMFEMRMRYIDTIDRIDGMG